MAVPDAFVIKFNLTKSPLKRAKLVEKLKEFLDNPSDRHAWLFYSLIYNLLGKRLFSIEKDLDDVTNVLSDLVAQDNTEKVFDTKPVDDEISKELLIQLDDILIEAEIIKEKRSEKEKKKDEIFGISLNTTISERFKTLLFGDGKVFGKYDNKLLEQNTLLPPLYFLVPFENVGEEAADHWGKDVNVLNPLRCIEEYGGCPDKNYGASVAMERILNCLEMDNLPMEMRRKAAALLSIMSINVNSRKYTLQAKANEYTDYPIPNPTRIKCFLLSWHTHMFDTDVSLFVKTENEFYRDIDMWLQPIGVNLKDVVGFMHVRKNLLFFTSESLTTGLKDSNHKGQTVFGFL